MENSTSHKKLNLKMGLRLPKFGMSPEADWKIIFISTTILLSLIIVLSVFIFIKIDKGDIFLVEQSGEEEKNALDLLLLEETVSYYENKAVEFEKIKNSKPSAVDPSL